MMKKAIKKLLAALLAVAMVCAMAIPAFADTESIREHHSFKAFQIFKGNVNDASEISNVEWGSCIHDYHDFLAELKKDPTLSTPFQDADSLQKVLAVISTWHESDDNSIAFARFVCHYLYPTADADPQPFIPTSGDVVQIPNDGAGYYLIVDTTYFNPGDDYHAYNSFLLNVTKAPWNLKITPKVEKPSVKKEVFDNQDGTSNKAGFGSSADHAINEEFQFKLTATLPASYDNDRAYDYYDKYTVIFNDTLSEGITYDGIDKVVIESNGNTYDITGDSSKYTIDITDLESHNYFTVGISNVKTCVPDLNKGATITVTYIAHLNDKAAVNTASGSTENKNSVRLQYSNNPRDTESFWGYTPEFTPESAVCVYTYQLNNTKRAESADGAPLKDVGFCLYSDEACAHKVELYKEGDFYFPIKDATDKKAVEEMYSDKDGKFNIKGLDAGTYYLKETTPPADYSACGVTPVTIKANHTEERVDLDGSTLSTTIINNKAGGITLPSTGGIGTTLFYVVGGGLMVAAIVLLVTKKRMENK